MSRASSVFERKQKKRKARCTCQDDVSANQADTINCFFVVIVFLIANFGVSSRRYLEILKQHKYNYSKSSLTLRNPTTEHKKNKERLLTHTIHHFLIDHNAPCLCPELCVTIVFDFSWDDCNTLEKLETMHANFWGVKKVHYGLCESSQ